MRIEGIESELLVHLAAQNTTYIDEMGLNGKVQPSSLEDNSGTRKLDENRWRGLDLYEVVKGLQVSDNKLMILSALKRSDWIQILHLLDKDQLLNGLRFFSKEKLLRLMTLLPKRLLIKMLLHLFPMEYLIAKMPTEELFNILRDGRLTEREMVKGFRKMPMKFLHFILNKITNAQVSHLKQAELLDIFMKLKKRMILNGMRMLPYKALTPFVLFHTQNNPDLLVNMSQKFMFDLFSRITKPTLIDAFQVVDNDIIIKFLSQLPDNLLIQAAAQVDDKVFEQYLLYEQPQLLAYLAGALEAA
ncbi:MAG: hypothetical protein KTR14_00790 [Vampirovibrio sp.]|nr:hypothetical protein [Vampirovibrio sp.]